MSFRTAVPCSGRSARSPHGRGPRQRRGWRPSRPVSRPRGAAPQQSGWTDGTPALCNDAGLAAAMEHAAVSVFGKSGCVQIEPQMISEDFACYGSEVPICCALLGVGSPVGLHSAAFCPDSSVLLPAARFLAESAWSVLEDARA